MVGEKYGRGALGFVLVAVRGAYGFALRTPEAEELPDLVSAPDNAPSVTVSWALGSSLVDIPDLVENGRYQLAHRGGGILEVIRDPGSVRMLFPVPASPAAVVHPVSYTHLTLPTILRV